MEGLYNVYAWQWKADGSTPAVRVAEGVDITRANFVVEAYLNRPGSWDAYAVEQTDDPGWEEPHKQTFEEFVKSASEFWGDSMPSWYR